MGRQARHSRHARQQLDGRSPRAARDVCLVFLVYEVCRVDWALAARPSLGKEGGVWSSESQTSKTPRLSVTVAASYASARGKTGPRQLDKVVLGPFGTPWSALRARETPIPRPSALVLA
jgi:hypothetical protein